MLRVLAQGFEPWYSRLKVGHIASLSRQYGRLTSLAEALSRDGNELGPVDQPALGLLPLFLDAGRAAPGSVSPLDAVLPYISANDTSL